MNFFNPCVNKFRFNVNNNFSKYFYSKDAKKIYKDSAKEKRKKLLTYNLNVVAIQKVLSEFSNLEECPRKYKPALEYLKIKAESNKKNINKLCKENPLLKKLQIQINKGNIEVVSNILNRKCDDKLYPMKEYLRTKLDVENLKSLLGVISLDGETDVTTSDSDDESHSALNESKQGQLKIFSKIVRVDDKPDVSTDSDEFFPR